MAGLIVFDLDGVITSEVSYWNTARQGLRLRLPELPDPLPPDFIYWAKNHAINHNWDVAFLALTAAGEFDAFCCQREALSGRALLESCPGYRAEPWSRLHRELQEIQDTRPLPDESLDSPEETAALFATLAAQGHQFAVATGRPKPEAIAPLKRLGILGHFPADRIVTHDEVQKAEQHCGIPLGKPHPFVLYRAMYPNLPLHALLHQSPGRSPMPTWFIGDTASDMGAAQAAQIPAIGILSALPPGKYREERRARLKELGCEVLLNSVLDLPAVLESWQYRFGRRLG